MFEENDYLKHNLKEILVKLKDFSYNCRFKELDISSWCDDEIIFMVLPLLDYIYKKFLKDAFICNLLYDIKYFLDIEVQYNPL